MVKLPSASALKRAMACQSSLFLPQVSSTSEDAEKGNAIHVYLADIFGKGRSPEESLQAVPEKYRGDCSNVDVDSITKLGGCTTEITYAFDGAKNTARSLGTNLGRDYSSASPDEFCGTADRVGMSPSGLLRVDDFKTGYAQHVEAAADNWQLKFLAVCLQAITGAEKIEVAIVRTLGAVREDVAVLDSLDLSAARFSILQLFGSIKALSVSNETPQYVEGSHCTWCPAWGSCPAKVGLIRQMVQSPSLLAEDVLGGLSPRSVGMSYARYREIKTILNKMDLAFREYAEKNGGIQLANGKTWGPQENYVEEIDPAVARTVLREMFGESVADAASTFDISKSSIDRALSTVSARGTKAANVRRVIEAVSQRGGVVLTKKVKFEEK